jgi:hypothetical protein
LRLELRLGIGQFSANLDRYNASVEFTINQKTDFHALQGARTTKVQPRAHTFCEDMIRGNPIPGKPLCPGTHMDLLQ